MGGEGKKHDVVKVFWLLKNQFSSLSFTPIKRKNKQKKN
jgi:hypothetical protein